MTGPRFQLVRRRGWPVLVIALVSGSGDGDLSRASSAWAPPTQRLSSPRAGAVSLHPRRGVPRRGGDALQIFGGAIVLVR